MQLYANENNQSLPRTTYDMADPTARAYTGALANNPFASDGPQPNDVTAALYLLLRTQDMTSQMFICPASANRDAWDFGGDGKTVQDFSNFPSDKNLSYSIANPYPSKAAVKHGYRWTNTLKADFALAADMNPGTSQLRTLQPNDRSSKQQAGNTRNHAIAQNVLYGDGHVEFCHTSFAGVDGDNIYGPGGLINAGLPNENINPRVTGNSLNSSPIHKDDSVLLPVATSDPGGPIPPTDFQRWWNSHYPRAIAGWILVALASGWAIVRRGCVKPLRRMSA